MARFAFALAAVALVAAVLPWPGMYVGLGAGLAGLGWGAVAWRQRSAPGGQRLLAAAALTLAVLGTGLAGLRIGLTLAAIDRIERML